MDVGLSKNRIKLVQLQHFEFESNQALIIWLVPINTWKILGRY